MMQRILLLWLALAALPLAASEPIKGEAKGGTDPVTQPHVVADLIPEKTTITAGEPFDIILHLHMDKGWHTYWINPGDAGLATSIRWKLPPGFTAGPIQWPTPELHSMGPLVTYGYEGDVYLLTTITPPKGELPQHIEIKANADWLVCLEECIPGKADFTLQLDSGLLNFRLPIDNKDFFDQARERLPVANTRWDVHAAYAPRENPGQVMLALQEKAKDPGAIGHLYFFPEQSNVLSTLPRDTQQSAITQGDAVEAINKVASLAPHVSPDKDKAKKPAMDKAAPAITNLAILLQQNGDKPDKLSGVVVSDVALIGDAKAVTLAEFSVEGGTPAPASEEAPAPAAVASINTATNNAVTVDHPATASPEISASSNTVAGTSTVTTAASSSKTAPALPPPPEASGNTLLGVLFFAFIGGLILNLMPCVLPVLSLKVFSLIKHGDDPRAAWKQGAAFTAGVVISFWLLAGVLLALKAAGNQLGWGFQMQSPGFVLALVFIFFLLGLNLFGVFEIGTSLVGLDAKATGKFHGLASSFFNGALATLAATPCTAPFMGSALGFAAQQPAAVSLLIFTVLALGMAAPYLLLTIFPGALRFVPKPGAWMESFKQFMGFLLMGTVIFLLYVFGALVGEEQIFQLLLSLLILSVAGWFYGGWQRRSERRVTGLIFAVLFLLLGFWIGVTAIVSPAKTSAASSTNNPETSVGGWQPWSPEAVDQTLAAGKPVFVDFTAAWCLSCKVNERVALDTDAVQKAFADKKVVLFKADWTHSDPRITAALRQYNRDGVPLYLLYSPAKKDAPQVLPEVLTPGIVLDALGKL